MADNTILVVEDDRALAVGLDINLTAEGYQVLVATDGLTGLRLALDEDPALVLLDLRLPELDGMELLAQLRARGRQMPVLILSARGEESDKVEGLNVGADDYVTKPFGINELVARIQAALRRSNHQQMVKPPVRFGELEVDVAARRVWRAGKELQLTPRELDLLLYLLARAGQALSREALLAAVWGYDYDGTTRTVDNFVRNLRVKLERDPSAPAHLITVPSVGYRLDLG